MGPRAGLEGRKSRPIGIRSPDCSASSSVAIPTELPGPFVLKYTIKNNKIWRILTNKEIYARVTEPTITETIRVNRLFWFGHVQRMEGNRIPIRVLYIYEFWVKKIER